MSNIAFSPNVVNSYDWVGERTKTFTVQGAAAKTLCLLLVMACTFSYTWIQTTAGYGTAFTTADAAGKMPDQIDLPSNVIGLAVVGVLGAFVVAMFTIFVQKAAPITAPIYAALEGLALGAISAGFEAKYPGIVMEAMSGVIGTAAMMGLLYSSGILRPTQGFIVGVLSAMFGILMLYLADIIMQAFGCQPVALVHGNSMAAIAIQVVIVGVAALNLIIDFGTISEAAENRAPKWYEWYAAFGLMLTIVWLYLEMLRLLAKLKSESDD